MMLQLMSGNMRIQFWPLNVKDMQVLVVAPLVELLVLLVVHGTHRAPSVW